MKKNTKRACALLMCFIMVLSVVNLILPAITGAAEETAGAALTGKTNGTTDHIADTDSSASYKELIELRDEARRAGRVWADKTVFSGDITLGWDDDGYGKDIIKTPIRDASGNLVYVKDEKGNDTNEIAYHVGNNKWVVDDDGNIKPAVDDNGITIVNESDFLHMFSALGSSQQKKTIQALDVVFILDTSASMSSSGEWQFLNNGTISTKERAEKGWPNAMENKNPRLEKAVDALNDAIGKLMGGDYNRVAVVNFNTGARTIMPLGRYEPTQVERVKDKNGDFVENDKIDKSHPENYTYYSGGLRNGEVRYLTVAQASTAADRLTGAAENKVAATKADVDTDHTQVPPSESDYAKYDNSSPRNVVSLETHFDDRFPQVLDPSKTTNFLDGNGFPEDWKIIEINAVSEDTGAFERPTWWSSNDNSYRYLSFGGANKNIPYINTSSGTDTHAAFLEGMHELTRQSSTTLTLYKTANGELKTEDKISAAEKNTLQTVEIQRQPVIVMVSDGAPNTNGSNAIGYPSDWWAGTSYSSSTNRNIRRYDAPNGLLVAAGAAYMTKQVEMHYFYNGDSTQLPASFSEYQTLVYNVGLCLDDPESTDENTRKDGQIALAGMDPKQLDDSSLASKYSDIFPSIIRDWNSYKSSSSGVSLTGKNGSFQMSHPSGTNGKDAVTGQNVVDITSLDYPTEFIPAEQPEDLDQIFIDLMDKLTSSDTFTPVSGPSGAGLNPEDNLTYIDPIGKYMEVKNVKKVLLFGTLYDVAKGATKYYTVDLDTNKETEVPSSDDSEPENYDISRQFYNIVIPEGSTDAQVNPSYTDKKQGAFNLSDIQMYVETSGNYQVNDDSEADIAGSEQAFYVYIPAAALPIEVATVMLDPDGAFLGYATNVGLTDRDVDANKNLIDEYFTKRQQSAPIRFIYEVGISDEILTQNRNIDLTKVDATYLEKNRGDSGDDRDTREDGKIYFYSNWYNRDRWAEGEGFDGYVASDTYTFGNAYMAFTANIENRYYAFETSRLIFERPYANLDPNSLTEEQQSLQEKYINDADGDKIVFINGEYYILDIQYRGERTIEDPEEDYKQHSREYIKLERVENSADYAEGGFNRNGYYYVMIEYYDRNGLVQYALPRFGSEFGESVNGMRNEYLCWYNPETEDAIHYMHYPKSDDPDAEDIFCEIDHNADPSDPDYGRNQNEVYVHHKPGEGYYVAAIEGGLRVGDLSAGIGLKKNIAEGGEESKTQTADTYYMPTISGKARTGNITMNLYLGNNGRLAVGNTMLLITKTVVDLENKNRDSNNEEFTYTLKVESMASRSGYRAIKAVYEDGYGVWRALIDKVELETDNYGMLMYTNGTRAITKNEKGEDCYVHVGGTGSSSENESGSYTFTYFDHENDNHSFADMLGGGTEITVEAWLIPIDLFDGNGWDYNDNRDHDRVEYNRGFPIGTVDPGNIGHDISMVYDDNEYSCHISYLTDEIAFDENGEATFTLKGGEGYLFNGLPSGAVYTVTEDLSEAQVAEGVLLQGVSQKKNVGTETVTVSHHDGATGDPCDDEIDEDGEDNRVDYHEFDDIEHTYTVHGNTNPNFAEEVNYSNYVPKTEKIEHEHSDDGHAEVGDTLTYTIYWENYAMDAEGEYVEADVKVVDPLDQGVNFVSAEFVEKDARGNFTPIDEEKLQELGWSSIYIDNDENADYSKHSVVWFIHAAPKQSGYVRLTVKINADADSYWNDYVHDETREGSNDFEVLNRAWVQVKDYHEIYTEIVRTSTGAPHKTETRVGEDTEVSEEIGNLAEDTTTGNLVGPSVEKQEQIEYSISYVNYHETPATVTVTDKLDPGVTFVSASWDEDATKVATPTQDVDEDDIKISYNDEAHAVTWMIVDVEKTTRGYVTLVVEVNDDADKEWHYNDGELDGEGDDENVDYKVFNRASVQVGNDAAQITETIENPTGLLYVPLPETGRSGMLPFALPGMILFGAAAYYIYSVREKGFKFAERD